MADIKKVLVANRGEIAIRVFRTCRKMGIGTVAIYTHADRLAPHVRYADEAYCVSEEEGDTSYLKEDKILALAKELGAAIHPGYGFYAENAGFVDKCEEMGITFIGPKSKHITLMGSKTGARKAMMQPEYLLFRVQKMLSQISKKLKRQPLRLVTLSCLKPFTVVAERV